jgi:Cu-processing system ATP-binding protein
MCSFLPQRVGFPDTLTGREIVEFYRRLRGGSPDATRRVLQVAALNGSSDRLVGTYSGGMVQRLGLAVAMLPESPVLLLDEPTAALDPEGLDAFYGLVTRQRQEGGTVFFSSHQLGDVERLADRVAIIVGGRLAADLGIGELSAMLADRGLMRVRLEALPGGVIDALAARGVQATWSGHEIVVPGAAAGRAGVLDVIRGCGGVIETLTTEEGRLEDFYHDIVQARP